MTRALLAATVVALAVPAAASAESPRWGSFDFAIGPYKPDIDSEFAAPPRPYQQIFGSKQGWMFRLSVAKALFTKVGSLEAGLSGGYFQVTGKGLFAAGGVSGDETKLKIAPASAFLQYRFDFLSERYKVPLAPYGRVAFERYHWWVTDGNGDTSKDGATNGWSVAGGVGFLLDILDSSLARELDADSGVNHTYLFAEIRRAQVDDFGSSSSWDLSDTAYAFGLMFAF